jgi:hypothetical protein
MLDHKNIPKINKNPKRAGLKFLHFNFQNKQKLRKSLFTIIFVLLCLNSFLLGFLFFFPKDRLNEKSASANPFGSTLNAGKYNNCSYNGTFCSNSNSTNLVAYYSTLSKTSYPGSGQTIFDLSGKNNHATLGNNTATTYDPVYSNGEISNFNFNQRQEVITSGLKANFSSDFSLETWFRRGETENNTTNCQRLINLKSNQTGLTSLGIGICGDSIGLFDQNSEQVNISSTQFVAGTQWQHLTATYNNNTQNLKVFVNGVEHLNLTKNLLTRGNQSITIGAIDGGSNQNNFFGNLAVFRVYNSALDSGQINSNFNSEKVQFGFVNNSLAITAPTDINAEIEVDKVDRNIDLDLNNLEFIDRRQTFVPYTVTARMTDMVTIENHKITKDKVSIFPNSQNNTVGSGLYNTLGQGGDMSALRTVINNTAPNGGGSFFVNLDMSILIPAFSRSGVYTSTITFDAL